MSVETHVHHDARCPRCGYDLHGMVESWKCECPINGVCTECGLGFEWGELLCPSRAVPHWCVEYGRWWSIPITTIKTVLVLFFRPGKFWRDLKMIHETRWGRFSALALLALFVLYLGFASAIGVRYYKSIQRIISRQPYYSLPYHPALYGMYAAIVPFSNYEFAYSDTRSSKPLTRRTNNSPRSFTKYHRPLRFWGEVSSQIRNGRFTNPFQWELRLSTVIVQGMMLAVLCPLAFVALPQSLRKAKVHSHHLVRIAMYSLLIIVPLMGLYTHNLFHYIISTSMSWQFRVWLVRGFLIYVLVGMVIWWSHAAKYYLKLPHAWGVGASMVILAYLGGMFLVSFIDFLIMLLPE